MSADAPAFAIASRNTGRDMAAYFSSIDQQVILDRYAEADVASRNRAARLRETSVRTVGGGPVDG